jgi:TP901 family phage tail tape measure protein
MAGENIVTIVVKASDDTAAGFGASADSAAASAEAVAAAQDKVTQAEMKLRDAQIQQTDAQLKLEGLQQSGAAKADELAAAQDKVTAATLRAADAQIRLGEADEALAGKEALAGDAAGVQAEKVSAAGDKAAGAGAAFGNFGMLTDLAIAGIGYESVKMAMSFQKAMELLVTQAGVPQKELGSLKSGILDLAGAVGFSPDSLAVSLYHVASNMESLGATAPQMLNAVRIAAEGAKTGNANLEDVTNALTAAIASGIPGVSNYEQAMGVLNATVGVGDMKMQDLADAFGGGMLATVKGFGVTLNEVGAALATFGDSNIRGAKAGTELRMAVQALGAPGTGPVAAAALKKLGLAYTQLGTDMASKGGLQFAINDLAEHMIKAGYTGSRVGEIITQAFGKKAGTGINVLVEQLDRFNSKFKPLKDGADQFGKAWGDTQKNLSQQWDELKGTFDALLTGIGSKLIPVLSSVAGFLLKNKGLVETLTPVILGLVAAFALAAVAVKAFEAAQAVFSLLTSPIGLVIIAIALLAVGIYELVKHWKTVEKAGREAARAIEGAWSHVYSAVVSPVIKAFDTVKKTVGAVWSDIWRDAVAPVIRAFDAVKEAITSSFDSWWKSHGAEVKEVWGAIWRFVSDYFKIEWDIVVAVVKIGWAVISAIFKTAWTVTVAIVKTGWDLLMAVMKPAMDILITIFKVSWDVISTIFKVAWDLIAGIVKIAIAAIQAIIKVTWDIIVGIFNVFLDVVTGHWGKAWDDIKATVTQVVNAVKGFLSAAWDAIKGTAVSAWNALYGGVKSILSDLLGLAARLPGEILGALGDVGHLLWNAGVSIVKGLISGITSMIGDVTSTVSGIASKVAGFFGLSPAKEGPLAGGGAPFIRGQHFAADIAAGMASGHGSVAAAARQLASSAAISPSAGTGPGVAGGGQFVLQISAGGGGSGLDALFMTWLKNNVRASGGDPRMFNKKVAFQ